MAYIYLIENTINQKKYIGQTRQRLSKRIYQHFQEANKGTSTPLYHALRRYSRDTFKFVILEETEPEYLNEREQYYIKKFNTFKEGYNCDKGGAGASGFKHSEETKRRISELKKGKTSGRKGKTNSAESNRKRSESLKRAYAEGRRSMDYSHMKGDNNPNRRKSLSLDF